jgi:hypothetical protein
MPTLTLEELTVKVDKLTEDMSIMADLAKKQLNGDQDDASTLTATIKELFGNRKARNELEKEIDEGIYMGAKVIIAGTIADVCNARVSWRVNRIQSLARSQFRTLGNLVGLVDLLG